MWIEVILILLTLLFLFYRYKKAKPTMSMPVLKMFSAADIPDIVKDSVVYRKDDSVLVVEGGDILHRWNGKSVTFEYGNFVKEVLKNNKREVFLFLINSGVKLRLGDLVYFPSQHGHRHIVEDILRTKRIEVDKVTKYGFTALEIAALNGWTDVVVMLVREYGARVNFVDGKISPLRKAVEGGHYGTVEALIKMGAKCGNIQTTEDIQRLIDRARQEECMGELLYPGKEHDRIQRYLAQERVTTEYHM